MVVGGNKPVMKAGSYTPLKQIPMIFNEDREPKKGWWR